MPRGAAGTVTATIAAFRLPATLSRAVAYPAGDHLLVATGLHDGARSTGTVIDIALPGSHVTVAGRLPQAVHDAAGALFGGMPTTFGGGAASEVATIQQFVPAQRTSRTAGTLPVPTSDWDDHVATPNVEHTTDGVQLAYGPRVPLLMFGGPVRPGIDSRWSSHPSIGKTVLDLLGLPPLGVPRLDQASSLADLVEAARSNPAPPAYGSTIIQPAAPQPAPAPAPAPAPPVSTSTAVGPVILRGGGALPPPND